MGKPARLILTILLFFGLGLATSVAVAWGAQARLMVTKSISKSGVRANQWFGVSLYRGVSTSEQGTLVWRLPETGEPPGWSNLRLPPRDKQTQITVLESGWPWRCLGYELVRDAWEGEVLDLGQRGALYGSLELSTIRKGWKNIHRLPYFINPVQLIANTLFWVLAWLAFFCLPSVWRINQWYRLKSRRYCAWCKYDLKHATGNLCTECGKDQTRRPPLVSKPAASLAFLLLLLVSVGMAGITNVFITKRMTEPIHWASYQGDIETLQREISTGVDVNIRTQGHVRTGTTPLMLSVIGNRPEVAELLLQNGASHTWQGTLSEAPELAAQNGQVAILQSMIRHGLDLNMLTLNGRTLLEWAVLQNHHGVVEMLLKAGADDTIVFSYGNTLLHYAAEQGLYELVQELLERGHDVNQVGVGGLTPLMYASGRVFRFLQSDSGMDDVIIAEEYGREIEKLARFLIEHGADVNMQDDQEMTPLHHAASKLNDQVVKLLLDMGMDTQAVADEGRTRALSSAIRGSYTPVKLEHDYKLRVMQQLVEAGADVNGVPGQLYSPLAWAIFRCGPDIVEWLLDHGAAPDRSALEATVNAVNTEMLAELIERGGNALERNSDGETLLFTWQEEQGTEARKALIKAGIDVNTVNKKGETALMRAVEARNIPYIKILLEHGADPTIQMPDGKTALDLGKSATIRKLLEEAIEKWIAEHGARKS